MGKLYLPTGEIKSGDVVFYEGTWLINGIQHISDAKGHEILWTQATANVSPTVGTTPEIAADLKE